MSLEVTIEVDVDGVWAWFDENPGVIKDEIIRKIFRKRGMQAFQEWVVRPGKLGLQHRFSPEAMTDLNLTPRDRGYTKVVKNVYGGRYLPYTSPKKRLHVRDMLKFPGSGYNLRNRNGTDDVVITLTLPGARRFNLMSSALGPTFRKEFLDFNGRGKADGQWIIQRTLQLAAEDLKVEMNRPRRRKLKGT